MSFARGLFSQFEVVHALVLRETRTRFGAHQLGYLWAVLEPVLMIVTFFILFEIAHRKPPFGMDLFGFVATGIVPYLLFSNSVNRVADSINGNKALLFYPHVQPLDLVYARCILEAGTHAAVFMVLMGGNIVYNQKFEIDNAMMVVMGFGLASLLGTTMGLVFCALGQFSNAVDRARGPILRPLFWISGIFFTADALPSHVRDGMLINPVLHTVEMVRAGWYMEYDATYVDASYVLGFILVFAFVGLTLERVVRRRIEVT